MAFLGGRRWWGRRRWRGRRERERRKEEDGQICLLWSLLSRMSHARRRNVIAKQKVERKT